MHEPYSVLLLPFAYNWLGHESRVTEMRCDKAIQLGKPYAQIGKTVYAVTSAGYSKASPLQATERHPESLGQQMARYIKTVATYPITVIDTPRGWGTLSELEHAMRTVEARHILRAKVYAVSSKDHLPRIRRYAEYILPPLWEMDYIPISHTLEEPWKERQKFLKDFPRLILHRISRA